MAVFLRGREERRPGPPRELHRQDFVRPEALVAEMVETEGGPQHEDGGQRGHRIASHRGRMLTPRMFDAAARAA